MFVSIPNALMHNACIEGLVWRERHTLSGVRCPVRSYKTSWLSTVLCDAWGSIFMYFKFFSCKEASLEVQMSLPLSVCPLPS